MDRRDDPTATSPPRALALAPGVLLLAALAAHLGITIAARRAAPPGAPGFTPAEYWSQFAVILVIGWWRLQHRVRLVRGPADLAAWHAALKRPFGSLGRLVLVAWLLTGGAAAEVLIGLLDGIVLPSVLAAIGTPNRSLHAATTVLLVVALVQVERWAVRAAPAGSPPQATAHSAHHGVALLSRLAPWSVAFSAGAVTLALWQLVAAWQDGSHLPLPVSLLAALGLPALAVLSVAALILLGFALSWAAANHALLTPGETEPLSMALWSLVPGAQIAALPRLLALLRRRGGADAAAWGAGALLGGGVTAAIVLRLLDSGWLPAREIDPVLLPIAVALVLCGTLAASLVVLGVAADQRRATVELGLPEETGSAAVPRPPARLA